MKQVAVIIFLAFLAYSNIFNNQFVIDDHIFAGKYQPNVLEAFSGVVPKGHEGVYRPIRGLFYTLYGSNPTVYHLNSFLVHALSSICVYLIMKKLISNSKSKTSYFPFMTALLFALHPVHTETITYIASGMDSIGIVFFLASFYLYVKDKFWISILFALFAFFTTEMALTLPILIIFYEWVFQKLSKQRIVIYGSYFLAVTAYIFIRFLVLQITTRGPYLAGSVYVTMLTMIKVVMWYIWVLIWPVNLMNNHSISPGIEAFVYRGYRTTAIMAQSLFDPIILGAIGAIVLIWVMCVKLKHAYPIISFAIGLFFIGLLPVMELIPQGSIMNERSLYISSIGFVMLVGYGLQKLGKIGLIGMIILSSLYGFRTYTRNRDWHDDITIWAKDVQLEPTENAYARFALGNAYNDQKQYAQAVEQYQKSVEINPGFAVGFASLSRTYRDMGEITLSNQNYQKAEDVEPGFWSRP